MAALSPYADDAAVLMVGGLTIENGRERIAIHGSLDLTRDRPGLQQARALHAALAAVLQALEADPALPEKAPPPAGPHAVRNPFA